MRRIGWPKRRKDSATLVPMKGKATLSAVVIRADGTKEDLGVISEMKRR